MCLSVEFNEINYLLTIILIDPTAVFKILLEMVGWDFMELHHFIHLVEKLSNYILLILKIIFYLQ